jgi:hypothetical protein
MEDDCKSIFVASRCWWFSCRSSSGFGLKVSFPPPNERPNRTIAAPALPKSGAGKFAVA